MNTIWSNMNLQIEDWKDDIKQEYPELSEHEMYKMMNELNDEYLEDTRANLDIRLENDIIVIADIGLWNGRASGYKLIKSGKISDCLFSNTEYNTWYVDEWGDLKSDAAHHDGTNHYLYRMVKPNLSDSRRETFLNKIYEGTVTRRDITRNTTRIGDKIADVYGWKIRKARSVVS